MPTPEHFNGLTDFEERADDDELLRSRDIHTFRIEDVGNTGSYPVYFIAPFLSGFAIERA